MFLFCMLDILLSKFYVMFQFIVASNCPMFPYIYIYIYIMFKSHVYYCYDYFYIEKKW
jgi:hypothetical protein